VPYVVGIIGGLTVLAYSVSPVSVASLPLGELVSGFVMGGLIPLGTAAVADGTFHWEILPECLPLIIGIALIMLSNNGSDIEKDRAAGRTTLPVVLGRPRSLVLYRTLLGVWIALLILQPLLQVGRIAIAGILLTIVLGHKPFGFLIRAKLDPSDRIRQMKSVAASNMIGNGFLALTYGAAWLLQILRIF
jgi:1,4-dihydroxy-2-naphthoate octaprenyltransferase